MTELKPGPELDQLVAERVMGCRVIYLGDPLRAYCGCGGLSSPHEDDEAYGFLPYSTSIEAAWEVVKKHKDWEECARFTAALQSQVKSRLGGELSESYLILHVEPVDICLAALNAVGIKK